MELLAAIVWGILGISGIFGWALGVSDPYNMLGNADPTYDFYNNPEIQTSIGFAVYEGIDFTVFHAPAGWGAAEATAPTLGWGDGKMFGWVGIPEETLGGFLDGFGDVDGYSMVNWGFSLSNDNLPVRRYI